MRTEALAYYAGFFDGEGSITIHNNAYAPRAVSPNHTLQVSIGNTDPSVIRMLHQEFGGSFVERKNILHPNHRRMYQWVILARKALVFLQAIQPYVRMKSGQVQVAITYQESKVRRGPKRLTPEILQWREEQRNAIIHLNGRIPNQAMIGTRRTNKLYQEHGNCSQRAE